MKTKWYKDEIIKLRGQERGVYTGKEFRHVVADVIEQTGVKQLPSETVMASVIKYMTFVAPKMSLDEFRLAFEMLNTGQFDVFVERPPLFNLRLVSQVANEYHRLRMMAGHEQRIYAPPPESVKVESSNDEWLNGLKNHLAAHGQLPLGYRWLNCVEALLCNGTVNNDEMDDCIAETYVALEKKFATSVNMQERNEIDRIIKNENRVRLIAAKTLIENLYKQNRI